MTRCRVHNNIHFILTRACTYVFAQLIATVQAVNFAMHCLNFFTDYEVVSVRFGHLIILNNSNFMRPIIVRE